MQTDLVFRVREGRLLHSLEERHEVRQTLVPEDEGKKRRKLR